MEKKKWTLFTLATFVQHSLGRAIGIREEIKSKLIQIRKEEVSCLCR